MSTLRILNARWLDVTTMSWRQASSIDIADGRIRAIHEGGTSPAAADASVPTVDAQGLSVMPGLIDCHVHVLATTFNLALAARWPNVFVVLRALPVLSAMLDRGFTTVRDAGGADWALAEATRTGLARGPRIFPSGKALSQTGGHADFRPRSDLIEDCDCTRRAGCLGRIVDGVDACRLAVREEIQKGATQIKIMASGGVASPTDPIANFGYSEAEIRAIVEEASHANTYVLAHAYTPAAIARAVRFGVRTIEHGNLVDAPTAELMRERGAYMVPTLVTYDALARDGARFGLPAESVAKIATVHGAGRRALEILARAGVKMGLGSDLLGETHGNQSDELKLRAEVLGTAEALRQATVIGAEIVNRPEDLGRIAVGAVADLLLVEGDPLANIDCLLGQGERIAFVIRDGQVMKSPSSIPAAA
jgi:imidazolonepropionase-like amidohydrolase